jgi:hypothetical protein
MFSRKRTESFGRVANKFSEAISGVLEIWTLTRRLRTSGDLSLIERGEDLRSSCLARRCMEGRIDCMRGVC